MPRREIVCEPKQFNGLNVFDEFISVEEERRLIDLIETYNSGMFCEM